MTSDERILEEKDSLTMVVREVDPMLVLTTMFHMGTLSIKAAKMTLPKEVMIEHITLISAMQSAVAVGINATEEEVKAALVAADKLEEESQMLGLDDIDETWNMGIS
tara:strand:- start:135 stop:455 length:321 start_codon:yes stop_codon:yes gene_type:complete